MEALLDTLLVKTAAYRESEGDDRLLARQELLSLSRSAEGLFYDAPKVASVMKSLVTGLSASERSRTSDLEPTEEAESVAPIAAGPVPPGPSVGAIVGQQEAKDALRRAIVARQQKSPLSHLLPRTVLLSGPPGLGKSVLTRAVVRAAEAQFIEVSPSAVLSQYHGVAEKRIRSTFTSVMQSGQFTVVFFDEIDALASSRSSSHSAADRRVLIELLLCLDLVRTVDHMVIVAATNLKRMLDPAVLRRFDVDISLELPSQEEREQILTQCLENLGASCDDIRGIAEAASGLSPALLENAVRRAVLEACESRDWEYVPQLSRADLMRQFGSVEEDVAPDIPELVVKLEG